MNYLAHAYLSFNHSQILFGNMISDFVKGRKKLEYPIIIQKGIELHRAIDEFTDSHEVTKKAKSIFRPAYGLYAGAFVDIVYDYFLANDAKEFSDNQLALFADKTYHQLKQGEGLFPERFHQVFHYMKLHNWLYNYQYEEAIQKTFHGLVHRAAYLHDAVPAKAIFTENLEELNNCYNEFFPVLKSFAYRKFSELVDTPE